MEEKKKFYTIELTRKGLCFIGIGAFFALLWMFVFGVFVGQEVIYLPFSKNISKELNATAPLTSSPQTASPSLSSEVSSSITPTEKEETVSYETTKLDSLPKEKETPLPKEIAKSIPSEVATKGNNQYSVQVGAFKDRKNAITFQNKLKQKGYKSYIEDIKTTSKGYYRVYVGPYPLAEALNIYVDLTAKKYSPLRPRPLP
jgi:cell division septation protein DedD